MAEITTFPAEHLHESKSYQRLSLLALASFLIAIPFAAILAFLAIRSLQNKAAIMLPVGIQIIPVVGFVLAIVSLILIRRSEGLLAGRRLALSALWVCVLVSLAYWAYYAATYLAVRQQADTFVQAWLRKLADDKLIPAFLDMLPPAARQVDPDDAEAIGIRFNQGGGGPKKGMLDQFREHEAVRAIRQGGNSVQFTPLGVRDWDYKADNNSFTITRSYLVSTPETTLNVDLTAVGSVSRAKEFQGRAWQIGGQSGQRDPIPVTHRALTQRGQDLERLIPAAAHFLDQWWGYLAKGDFYTAYLETKGSSERQSLQATYIAGLLLAGSAAGTAPPVPVPEIYVARVLPAYNDVLACNLYLPGFYETFSKLGIFKSEKLKTSDQKTKNKIFAGLRQLTSGVSEPNLGAVAPRNPVLSALEKMTLENGKSVIPLETTINIGPALVPGFTARMLVQVEGPEKLDPDGARPPIWRVRDAELISGIDMANSIDRMRQIMRE